MKPLARPIPRVAPSPLAVCLAVALGLGAPPIGAVHADVPPSAVTQRHGAIGAHGSQRVPSGTFVVSNCNDSGPGSFRDAASHAGSNAVIDLTALPCSTITLSTGAVNLLVDYIYLVGPGSDRLTIAGNGVDRVIGHGGNGEILLYGMTLRNGAVTNSAGGCLYSPSYIYMTDVTISACRTDSTGTYTVLGGGVYARGGLKARYSTISGNLVTAPTGHAYGGGAFVRGDLVLSNSTISDNTASGLTGNTGGIAATGNVNIYASTISGNQAQFNAGLGLFAQYATGRLHIRSSTISGNVASIETGGIGVRRDIEIYNSTITGNQDAGGPAATGGLFLAAGVTAYLGSTIIAGNTTGAAATDVTGYTGAAIAGSNNLVVASTLALPPGTIRDDPLLGPLADNGGPTKTHALQSGSPAIGAGANSCECAYDQRARGFAREVGNGPDVGAFEIQSSGAMRTVDNCNDAGAGSLRDAAANVVSGDIIDLSALACSTITLTSGPIAMNQGNVTLVGPGADALTIDGTGSDRILEHDQPGTLAISDLALANGYEQINGPARGGCIWNRATLALDGVRISSCRAVSTGSIAQGGAVYTFDLDMNRSTISDSTAGSSVDQAEGGAVFARTLTMRDSVIDGNSAYGVSGESFGGGLYVPYRASIARSTISNNRASEFAGALLSSVGTLTDSTVSGNTAFEAIGGVFSYGLLAIYNSTVAFNTAASGTGGVGTGGPARLQSTIVFGNTSGSTASDVGASGNGSIIGSHDLVGVANILLPPDTIHDDPLLGPLDDNGGATPTHALGAGSPAIDAGNNVANLDTDQRGSGFARVAGAAADIGAYEREGTADTIFEDGFDGS